MPISKCELDALFVDPFAELPPPATKHQLANGIPRAPRRNLPLNETEKRVISFFYVLDVCFGRPKKDDERIQRNTERNRGKKG